MLTGRSVFQQECGGLVFTQNMAVGVCCFRSIGGIIIKTVLVSCLMMSLTSGQIQKEIPVTCSANVATDGGSGSIVCDYYTVSLSSLKNLRLAVEFHRQPELRWDIVAGCNYGLDSCHTNDSRYSFVRGEGEAQMILNLTPLPNELEGSYVCSLAADGHMGSSKPCVFEDNCPIRKPLSAVEEPQFLEKPENLTRHSSCTWVITSSSLINLTIVSIATDRSVYSSCYVQHLSIYDGDSDFSPILWELCDYREGRQSFVVSFTNQMFVKYTPSWPAKLLRFKLQYQTMTKTDPMWDFDKTIRLAANEMQNISSLYYPYSYPRDAIVYWQVEVPEQHKVQLEVVQFDLNEHYCGGSSVEIYDGASLHSRLLVRMCGDGGNSYHVSTGEGMYILFRSGSQRSKGFKFRLSAVSSLMDYNTTLYVTSDEIKDFSSLYYPYSYPRNTKFYWLVVAPNQHKVQLDVVDFDLKGGLCHDSHVNLYDGSSVYSHLLATLCKGGADTRYVSSKHHMYITFHSGQEISKGFKFQLSSVSPDMTPVIVGATVGGIVCLVVLVTIIAAVVLSIRKPRQSRAASNTSRRDSSTERAGSNVFLMNPVIINHLHPSSSSPHHPSPASSRRRSSDLPEGYHRRSSDLPEGYHRRSSDLPEGYHRRSSERRVSDDLPPAYPVAIQCDLEVTLPPVNQETEAPPPYTDSMLDSYPPSSSGPTGGGAWETFGPAHRPISQVEATQRSSLQTAHDSDGDFWQPAASDAQRSAPQRPHRQQQQQQLHRQQPPPRESGQNPTVPYGRQQPHHQQPRPQRQPAHEPSTPSRTPPSGQPPPQRNSEDEVTPPYQSPHYPLHSHPLVRPPQQRPRGMLESEPTIQQRRLESYAPASSRDSEPPTQLQRRLESYEPASSRDIEPATQQRRLESYEPASSRDGDPATQQQGQLEPQPAGVPQDSASTGVAVLQHRDIEQDAEDGEYIGETIV